jgi:hypothetical protein
VVNKPSKASDARGQAKAESAQRKRGGTKPGTSGAGSTKPGKSKTKSDLEREIVELKALNAELKKQLAEQEARAEELARINRQAGDRVDKVIGRIRTMLAS